MCMRLWKEKAKLFCLTTQVKTVTNLARRLSVGKSVACLCHMVAIQGIIFFLAYFIISL